MLKDLTNKVSAFPLVRPIGRVQTVSAGLIGISGLIKFARIGDRVEIVRKSGEPICAEIVKILDQLAFALPDTAPDSVSHCDLVRLQNARQFAPSEDWLGRVVDPFGSFIDGKRVPTTGVGRSVFAAPPNPANRRGFGKRMNTGLAALNTFLPIVEGQRIGLFAGSGVGKSTLLSMLAKNVEVDVIVVALVGERGRELRDFVSDVLGPDHLKRSVIVAATSDQAATVRRRCIWSAMTIAEYFRDKERSVLFLADSITRFAEAHREVAGSIGELPALRGFPPSVSSLLAGLCERAGPGGYTQGDITAVFTVLVAGSDQDEPVSDIVRGILDGHIVLDREIAERARFPAIDLLRSVSRSLPAAANDHEGKVLKHARALVSRYEKSETMVNAGLYKAGSDPMLDQAIAFWPEFETFMSMCAEESVENSFDKLKLILRKVGCVVEKS